ncbi:MAG: hypothetical protein WC876_09070 [Candidatus Thermoplasmatota archaeon]|jgi:hypothetical protein
MTEHVVPEGDAEQGLVVLHGRTDTIRTTRPVILSLDSFGFGRLNVAWELAPVTGCTDCEVCKEVGPVPLEERAKRHLTCEGGECKVCSHHACPMPQAALPG